MISGGIPRRQSRTPLRPAAAKMIGSAACRERTLAARRRNRKARAAVSIAPLRDTPGARAHAWARPSSSASAAVAESRCRSSGERSAAASSAPATTCAPATDRGEPSFSSIRRSNRNAAAPGGRAPPPPPRPAPRPGGAELPPDPPLEQERRGARRQERQGVTQQSPAVELVQRLGHLMAQRDQERARRARVQRDLERLLHLG